MTGIYHLQVCLGYTPTGIYHLQVFDTKHLVLVRVTGRPCCSPVLVVVVCLLCKNDWHYVTINQGGGLVKEIYSRTDIRDMFHPGQAGWAQVFKTQTKQTSSVPSVYSIKLQTQKTQKNVLYDRDNLTGCALRSLLVSRDAVPGLSAAPGGPRRKGSAGL